MVLAWIASIRIPTRSAKTREALAQCIVRPPISEGGTDTVVYRVPYNDYFRTDTKVFPAVESLVEVLQHLPDSRSRLLRTYGLYSSRARGTPAPAAARQRCGRVGAQPALSVSAKQSRAAWARLIK